MSNFPFNITGMAQSVIGKQVYYIERYVHRVRNANGYWVSSYAQPEQRSASIQPLSSQKKQSLGLELMGRYISIISTDEIEAITRSSNPDRVQYCGFYYSPVSVESDFMDAGGWNEVIMVRGGAV